jgi:predicted TIM-barrel fold metal-dependent hydrolase
MVFMTERGATQTSEAVVVITGDTHLGGNHVDFAPYFDPEYRTAYDDHLKLAARAAKVLAERAAKAQTTQIDAMSGANMEEMALAIAGSGGPLLGILIDREGDGSGPYSPEYVAEIQRERKDVLESIGVPWDDKEFMTVPKEDDPELRLKMLELDGTVGSVLYPQVGFLLSTVTEPELQWAGIRAYNRFAAEFAGTNPDRFAATFMVDLADIPRAVEEATWAKEQGMRGGAYIAGGKPMGLPFFNDTYYAPFFDALAELELPFNMHGAFNAGDGGTGWQSGPGSALFNQTWTGYNSLNKGGPLMHFIAGGVFERHPNLRIVVAESGGAFWAAEVCQTLDEIYESDNLRSPINNLRVMNQAAVNKFREFPKKPSAYFASNVYVQGHNSAMDWSSLDAVGIDNVIWSSDFPHAESTWPFSMDGVRKNIDELKPSVDHIAKFMGANAAELYGFDIEKLRPVAEQVGPRF